MFENIVHYELAIFLVSGALTIIVGYLVRYHGRLDLIVQQPEQYQNYDRLQQLLGRYIIIFGIIILTLGGLAVYYDPFAVLEFYFGLIVMYIIFILIVVRIVAVRSE